MLTRCCAAVMLLTFLTGCGDDAGPDADAPASGSDATVDATDLPTASKPDEPTRSPTPESTEPRTRIVASDSEFGPMLFDGSGQAIYLFDIETSPRPKCYGECAAAWPPVVVRGDPVAGPGVESSLLATTERTDGSVQVTYNGHPLYFYAHEAEHEVKCHDVFMNGGSWYVVRPGGEAAPPV